MGVEVMCVEEIRKWCLEKTKITSSVYCAVEAPVNKIAKVMQQIHKGPYIFYAHRKCEKTKCCKKPN